MRGTQIQITHDLNELIIRFSVSIAAYGAHAAPLGFKLTHCYPLKHQGEDGLQFLTGIFNNILEGGRVPKEWRVTRIQLIHKGKGKDKADLGCYRPVAISSCVYKLYAGLLRDRLQVELETGGQLVEFQNGFRKGRRGSDNLFVITQLMEVAVRRGNPFFIAFLDIKGAFDNVNRAKLWEILLEYGITHSLVDAIRALYADTEYTIQWGTHKTEGIRVNKGVRQGCPLSPLLFLAYINELGVRLREAGIGYRIGARHLPGMLFCDDVALISESSSELQQLLDIAGSYGEDFGLSYGEDKSGVLKVNAEQQNAGGTGQTQWQLLDCKVNAVEEY